MAKGLLKLSNAANIIEAKRDFARLATQAINAGHVRLVREHFYPEGAGWRVIDKCIARLRVALKAVQPAR